MASFREWLLADETIREVYEGSLWALALEDARSRLVGFYNVAMGGNSGLFLEERDEEDDDDGPVEIPDPFADGDEDAKPVMVAPDEQEQKPESEKKSTASSGSREAEVKLAKSIQDASWTIRWGSMIQRADLVERVRRIYEDEWLPLVKEMDAQVKEEYRREFLKGGSDEEIRVRVAGALGVSVMEVVKSINRSTNQWSVLKEEEEEDDWGDVPDIKPKMPDIDEKEKNIIDRIEPLLLKLGYIDSDEMGLGTAEDRRKLAVKAMEAAVKETGNEVPDNETTKRLKNTPSVMADAQNRLWQNMYDKFMGLARASYRKLSSKMGKDDETGEEIRGSEHFQGAEEILSDVVAKLIESLSEREVNKDLSVQDWRTKSQQGKELTFLFADPEQDPNAVLGSLGARFRSQNVIRDVVRQKRRADAQATNSAQSAQRLSQGSIGDDGSQSSIDPKDTKTRDSLTTAAESETSGKMTEAFRQAMKELTKKEPDEALLACLWMGLECGPDGTVPTPNVQRLMSAFRGATVSSRQHTKDVLSKIGLIGKGRSGQAHWELVKKIKEKNVPLFRRISGMPPGEIPQNPPKKHATDLKEKLWYDYMMKVMDAKGDALDFLANRMAQIMLEETDELAMGQESENSWSLYRFLKVAFRDEISSGHAIVEGEGTNFHIKFYDKGKRIKVIRSFKLEVNNYESVVVSQDGFDSKFVFRLPKSTPGQPLNSRELIAMEMNLMTRLRTGQRKVNPKSKF